MAKTYYDSQYDQDSITHSYSMGMAAPFDSRAVVDTTQDLYTKSTFKYAELYVGMVVVTLDTNDIYVLSVKPKATVPGSKWADNIVWKKIGGEEIKPENYLSYYQQKLGAKILDSAESLGSIANPFKGQFAYVKDDPNTSEDESGLYIYTGQDWMKIFTGNSASGSVDISSVITSDGTVPTSGTGFSIAADDSDALVEETYVDNEFKPNTYYTSRGLNSSKQNGGSDIDSSHIKLTKGNSESYIKLNSIENDNWIELYIADNDDSLGFRKEDITWMDSQGVVHPMETNPLVLPKEIPISFGDKTVDFRGMTETRSDGVYTFGTDGSTYSDVDIYTSKVLPTVYAYADGTPVRVLTEGDKYELENMISEATDFSPITDEEIRNLFQ